MSKRGPKFMGFAGVIIFLFLFLWLYRPLSLAADTSETDLYCESLKFDSQGNLLMTTRDKKASGTTRYKTLGWIVKRTQNASDSNQTIRLKLEENGAPRTDPNDADYIFSYFKCSKEIIFSKIGAASADWQIDLYQNGGIVYLDAIMTVIEDGRQMGHMDESGRLYGEVYITSDGIINARDWAKPEALLTHYNKAVYFPPVPDMLVPMIGLERSDKIYFQYGEEERERVNSVQIQSSLKKQPWFDVTKGIPTGEQIFIGCEMQKYYYHGVLTHSYGMKAVPVEIEVTYTYPIETEEGIAEASFTSSFTYYVSRHYSYYRIDELELHVIQNISVSNGALPDDSIELQDLYAPRITLEQNRDSYMEIPVYHASVFGGNLGNGGGITETELQAIAENAAGGIWVRSDAFIVDGEIILDGSFVEGETRELVKQQGERLLSVCGSDMTIPHTKQNNTYKSHALVYYKDALGGGGKEYEISHVNDVVVHTPVVCKGGITDDIAHNQQLTPTPYCSLILGRSFTVGISTVGSHKDQPGYGSRDYEKYIKQRQVQFPFEVYDGDIHYAAGVWINLTSEQKEFYLPVGVHEGDYSVCYRTIAKNADAKEGGIDANEYLANLSLVNYGAYDELTVTIVGRMYDLAITDVVDYPRWKSVFYGDDGKKKSFAYWIGGKNLEGDVMTNRVSDGIFPILPGDHPYNRAARAVGLGYRVKLQLKTIGDMRGSNDKIVLIPTYYYISRDGSGREQVRLYQKEDLSEVYKPLILTADKRSFAAVENRNVEDELLRAQSVQIWDGEYQLSPDLYLVNADIDLHTYIRLHGGRIRQKDPVFKRDGYLLVQFEVRSCPSGEAHLSYVNRTNSSREYCNMWELQGFNYMRTDAFGNMFSFADGDCLLFDTKYSLYTDYESWGTH